MTNDRYRDRLSLDFGDMNIKTKEQLGILMRRKESFYRYKKTKCDDITDARELKRDGLTVFQEKNGDWFYLKPVSITQNQLDSAWEYLKDNKI